MSTDLLVDDTFQPVPRTNGDNALVDGDACFLQTLRMEASASEGDLWYDPGWGWSLLDFKGAVQDELTVLEIEQRVRQKLAAHPEILTESIRLTVSWAEDSAAVAVVFRLRSSEALFRLTQHSGRTEIEVIPFA